MAITRGIREFVSRDWRAAREAKDRYWGQQVKRLGSAEALRIADELRRQVLQQVPGWPSAEQREADLQAHIRLSELLTRAGRARRA
ncbi:MAG TPA: hypothetical protein VGQ37_01850 [Vicinamibacterales bacterium]|jgi:hypothetical protein|nr:hypothetical protein [Vicinamibacterales bacterium]